MKKHIISSFNVREFSEIRSILSRSKNNHIAQILIQALNELEKNGEVTILDDGEAEVSPQQAGALIGVSRPYLYRMLDAGIIPEQPRDGMHRRIKICDVRNYIHNRESEGK